MGFSYLISPEKSIFGIMSFFFFSFDSKPMILTPWFQNLAVDKLGVAKVPVLIRLPGLQLKVFDK